ncbi:MAG: alpha/beta hydrolase [Actinomycetota bacterium]|nr:alpha/beta hydrolase [Actinomycetota bacterium]MDA3013765.1 alpha/beta hydrolase [Actinomycetota bacterium]
MTNSGALVVHGLFEHKGRHQDNVNWLNNLGIQAFSINLPGHGDIKYKGHIESWNENYEAIKEGFKLLDSVEKKIVFAHSYGCLVTLSAVLSGNIKPDYLILSAPHFADNYPKFIKNLSGTLAKIAPKLRAPSPVTKKNISTDPQVVENYFKDPLVFRSLTVNFGNEINKAQTFVNENIEKLDTPTIVLHGENDAIVPISGCDEIKKLNNVTFIKVENSFHEILNQDTRPFVLSEIYNWLKIQEII